MLQFPLTALLCLLAAETVLPNRALAGSTPVAPPDSGNVVGDTFAPPIPPATGNILTEQAAGNVSALFKRLSTSNL
ncbi:MAG: hypothetical protein HC800_10165 [Phormidesmis sp. RL_2_1]|nr:hypothetical protein [Phormidesmis sp. RL_2_1]